MGLYPFAAFVHLVGAVLLVGYLLFWAIMALALGRRFAPGEVGRYLDMVASSRWPHVMVPFHLRLPWPMVGWVMLGAMIVTGGLLLLVGPIGFDGIMLAKLAAVAALLAMHHLLARRPRPPIAYAGLGLGLLIVALSAHLLR